jgi:hypothetical protein
MCSRPVICVTIQARLPTRPATPLQLFSRESRGMLSLASHWLPSHSQFGPWFGERIESKSQLHLAEKQNKDPKPVSFF